MCPAFGSAFQFITHRVYWALLQPLKERLLQKEAYVEGLSLRDISPHSRKKDADNIFVRDERLG